MKKLFLALALCAFVAAPAMADDHAAHGKSEEAVGHAEGHAADAAKDVPATKKAKKKTKKTAKKVTTETTQEGEAAPAEATHN